MNEDCAAGRQLISKTDPEWVSACPHPSTDILMLHPEHPEQGAPAQLHLCRHHMLLLPLHKAKYLGTANSN